MCFGSKINRKCYKILSFYLPFGMGFTFSSTARALRALWTNIYVCGEPFEEGTPLFCYSKQQRKYISDGTVFHAHVPESDGHHPKTSGYLISTGQKHPWVAPEPGGGGPSRPRIETSRPRTGKNKTRKRRANKATNTAIYLRLGDVQFDTVIIGNGTGKEDQHVTTALCQLSPFHAVSLPPRTCAHLASAIVTIAAPKFIMPIVVNICRLCLANSWKQDVGRCVPGIGF